MASRAVSHRSAIHPLTPIPSSLPPPSRSSRDTTPHHQIAYRATAPPTTLWALCAWFSLTAAPIPQQLFFGDVPLENLTAGRQRATKTHRRPAVTVTAQDSSSHGTVYQKYKPPGHAM